MSISDAGRKDPSMLGGTNYPRAPLDFYPTPARATQAFIDTIEDDLEGMQFWEPFAGNGAIYNLVAPLCRNAVATDIQRYEGFEPTGLFDFFKLVTPDARTAVASVSKSDRTMPPTLDDVQALCGFRPDCIITNPPYGKDAERAVRKALELMEPERGMVAFLMRHEWDAAKGRADLIDHPAFAMKVTLRFRPVWVERKAGEDAKSPRFSYAWYVWDWVKAIQLPHGKAELHYAG